MFSRLKFVISQSPVVHVVIAAFLGAAVAVLAPAVQGGDVNTDVARAAVYAGLVAAGRALLLLVPAKS